MLNNTHRQPARNPDAHTHEGDDFCLGILDNALRPDFRCDLALHVSSTCAASPAAIGSLSRELTDDVLDSGQLRELKGMGHGELN